MLLLMRLLTRLLLIIRSQVLYYAAYSTKTYFIFIIAALILGSISPNTSFAAAYMSDLSAPKGAKMSDGTTVETPRVVKNIGYVDIGALTGAVAGTISAYMIFGIIKDDPLGSSFQIAAVICFITFVRSFFFLPESLSQNLRVPMSLKAALQRPARRLLGIVGARRRTRGRLCPHARRPQRARVRRHEQHRRLHDVGRLPARSRSWSTQR